MSTKSFRRGFSLVELVIVVVIIGVIAAIAVPRISRGAKGAGESALRASLAGMRNAIDLFAAEHGGDFPLVGTFKEQLTTYSDGGILTSPTKDATYKYGPYLRALPPLPIQGAGATSGDKGDVTVAATAADGVGWIYNESTGVITANGGDATDEATTLYTDY